VVEDAAFDLALSFETCLAEGGQTNTICPFGFCDDTRPNTVQYAYEFKNGVQEILKMETDEDGD
jgi:hypothetical protein